MTIIKMLSRELEQEAQKTGKMLKRIPNDKLDWQPHPKSMTVRRLATHIAELPTWIPMILNSDELDLADNPYSPKILNDVEELMNYFQEALHEGKSSLTIASDEHLSDHWTLREGEKIYDTSPKGEVLRMTFCQIVHHRAQLGVYLRLLNIPIPGSYGSSADEENV
ncbi:hypothetical protein BH23BAC1_BH23BAC1_06560 [soil metagenome]